MPLVDEKISHHIVTALSQHSDYMRKWQCICVTTTQFTKQGDQLMPLITFTCVSSICGAIKQNQSEVGQIQFSELHFAENPIEIGQLVPKIWAVEGCQKQWETKDIFCFVWLYLKINISDFWLILLDHKPHISFQLPPFCSSLQKPKSFKKTKVVCDSPPPKEI